MGVVGGGEAASGDEDIDRISSGEGPEGDADAPAARDVGPARVGTRPMVLDRRPAEADLVVELAGGEHVAASQPEIAVDAPGLADADLGPERDERRPLVAR